MAAFQSGADRCLSCILLNFSLRQGTPIKSWDFAKDLRPGG
jgi:hypothetical protein